MLIQRLHQASLTSSRDHPNARHQKRMPEEKGSFGKLTRRKGSSRATRTQTPAKRENPALDGFEAALKSNGQIEAQKSAATTSQPVKDNKITIRKEPTQVFLYGFPSGMQWAALSFYEKVSGGMICEDYEREPPRERRRYQSRLDHRSNVPRRPLTKEERSLSMRYRGGSCWIKVTFDSREAADRAISSSPHVISGYWVYAQLFQEQGPESDVPILCSDEDRQQGLLGGPKPPQKAATLSAYSGLATLHRQEAASRVNATLPRSLNASTVGSDTIEHSSLSSATASSATVVALDDSQVRRRTTADNASDIASQTFTHFPNTPKTVLRPATEALLPQPSWSDRLVKRLTLRGWIPGDVIGNEVPKLESGAFDWESSSIYWRLCFLIDSFLGTDLCGLKDNQQGARTISI